MRCVALALCRRLLAPAIDGSLAPTSIFSPVRTLGGLTAGHSCKASIQPSRSRQQC